jgi:hypothetical protein
MARIKAERPAVVVLGVARHYDAQYHFTMYGTAWLRSFTATVKQIRSYGSRVLVLGPAAKPWTDQPDCLSGHVRRATVCATRRVTAVNAAGEAAERRVVTAAGGAYVDVAGWMCTATSCPSLVGNLLVYRDDNHLATGFARFLAPVLAEQLDAVLRSPRP